MRARIQKEALGLQLWLEGKEGERMERGEKKGWTESRNERKKT